MKTLLNKLFPPTVAKANRDFQKAINTLDRAQVHHDQLAAKYSAQIEGIQDRIAWGNKRLAPRLSRVLARRAAARNESRNAQIAAKRLKALVV